MGERNSPGPIVSIHLLQMPRDSSEPGTPQIWWSNGIFFLLTHLAAFVGVYYYPAWQVKRASLVLAFLAWQLADFGITVGYHRLYSHKAFKAAPGVRVALALLGSAGFQGSIKWWCLRHRLHHRYTDDPVHDPYAATNGLFYSHMGWIFYKPTYERMKLIERDDLDRDPVVRFQHEYYVPIALTVGFAFPPIFGCLWGDPIGSFVWAGLVSRLFIWHCTFLVNSLAHWDGLQPYSDEDTSRGNLILALLTGGEGNHNFHAFPHDFRSGPAFFDWDPSKWIIIALHRLGLVYGLRRAKQEDVSDAARYMHEKHQYGTLSESPTDESEDDWQGEIWDMDRLEKYQQGKPGKCIVLLDEFVLDVTSYLGDHTFNWAFHGGLNKHSRAANKTMRKLRIARFREGH
ncbi:hypothetical protein FA13DRAFT_1724731 [Coprinellus micaceus]|uniref:Acyl-CoA desaturase n=1 Tax=Coprinellus micaceus TaxID=71717 RepID=A0A4Y7TY88_COPMI|nr:hypothetical protein FA13DRAFT_1724731 [Coprinellus micaceus]